MESPGYDFLLELNIFNWNVNHKLLEVAFCCILKVSNRAMTTYFPIKLCKNKQGGASEI